MKKQFLPTQPYKGTRDFYPEDMKLRNWFFTKMREVIQNYGYEEYLGPILEPYNLYASKSGEELVREQLYSFKDKADRLLTIRPEMTPTVARMVASRINKLIFPVRWFSLANFMRYEKPQRGRLREHWQLNVDILGEDNIKAELEIFTIIVDIMNRFGADSSMFQIKFSNKKLFNTILKEVLTIKDDLIKTVSRIIDKKDKLPGNKYKEWLQEIGLNQNQITTLSEMFNYSIEDFKYKLGLKSEGLLELQELNKQLSDVELNSYCKFDFSIVRGLEYYTGTVFEVFDTSPQNRRSIFGGGRYDDLISLFKEVKISGVGFGLGDVTFQNFLETHKLIKDLPKPKRILVISLDENSFPHSFKLAREIRSKGFNVTTYIQRHKNIKKQMKYADKMKFDIVIILGENELKEDKITLKHLPTRRQLTLSRSNYLESLKDM